MGEAWRECIKTKPHSLFQAQLNVELLWAREIRHGVITAELRCSDLKRKRLSVETEPRGLKGFVVFQTGDPEWNLTSPCCYSGGLRRGVAQG